MIRGADPSERPEGLAVYIITGASRGLGAELAKQLLAAGASVCHLSRSENETLAALAARRESHYRYIPADLSVPERAAAGLESAFEFIAMQGEPISSLTLINNAATVEPLLPADACTPDLIVQSLHINLTAPIQLASAFLAKTEGMTCPRTIVNVTSGSGTYPAAGMSLYCAAKAGMDMFTRCVTLEQEKRSAPVRLIAFDPGMMDTAMQQAARSSAIELSAYFQKQKEDGALANPADVAAALIERLQGK